MMNKSDLVTQLPSEIFSHNYELSNLNHDERVKFSNIDIPS